MNSATVNITYIILNNTSNESIQQDTSISPLWSLEYSFLAVMVSALSITGIMGNIPVLIVYFRRRDNLASHTFIKILAFIDLIACIFGMPYTIVYELHLVTSDIACRFCEFLRHFTTFASAITLVAIAMERYVAVCQIGSRLNVNSLNRGVWIIFGLSAFLAAPAVGTFAVVLDSDVRDVNCRFPHRYTSGKFCHFTYTVMGKTMVTAYQVLQVVVCFTLVVILTVLYSIIYFVLWKKSLLKRKMVIRNCTDSNLDSSSDMSYGGQCQPIKCKRTRLCCESSSTSDWGKKSEMNRQNNEFESSNISNSLSENYSKPDSQTHAEDKDKRRKHTGSNNIKTARRKIKFSVSAQSGRSEKLKRKKYYHKRTAKMLFLCTIIFIVTWMPFWFDIFGLTNFLILRYMFFIGNATNPIVYGIVNEQVRRAFKRLFFDCVRKWCTRGAKTEIIEDSINLSGTTREKSNK